MKCFNETIRYHELAFRDLKKSDTSLIIGYQVFYNYIKKHIGFYGRTSVEALNSKVKGLNKRNILIQNVILHNYE